MNSMKKCFTGGLLSLSLLSASAFADWIVDNEQSTVFFISTKNVNVSEIHHFKQIEGKLNNQGEFSLDIDLASVETGIAIRNTRMQDLLFNVSTFPKAHIQSSVPAEIVKLGKGESLHTTLAATLTLMGMTKPLSLDVTISKTAEQSYVVTSAQPLLLSASDVGLQGGVEALQKIAGLSSIGLTVPVSFNLILYKD